jgi:hypothetical protein
VNYIISERRGEIWRDRKFAIMRLEGEVHDR